MLGYVKTITFNEITSPSAPTVKVINTEGPHHYSLVSYFRRAKSVWPSCCILDDIGNHLSKELAIFISEQVKQKIPKFQS